MLLTYSDGQVVTVDFKPVIEQGGVFAALRDPQLFSQVAVDERDRYIVWPGEIDFYADALQMQGEARYQTTPATSGTRE